MNNEKVSIKVTNKGRAFLKQMQINRIKLDLPVISMSQCIDLIVYYFKKDNNKYLEMLKEEDKNVGRD